jgi:hypothetical protein
MHMRFAQIYLRLVRKYGWVVLLHLKVALLIVKLVNEAPFYVRGKLHSQV